MSKTDTDPAKLLEALLDQCKAAGATDADARIARGRGVSVNVREGKLEDIERSESQGVALRCLFGQRQAHVSGSDLSAEGLSALAERCVAMAKAVPEDPYCGLAPAEDLARDLPELDLSGDGEISAEKLEADALLAEATALDVDNVKSVSSCSAGWDETERWVASTNGFSSYRFGGSSGLGLAVVAEKDGGMERDYDSWSTRKMADRPAPEAIGLEAATRAVARLGSTKIASRTAPVIYDRRISSSLLGALLGAISGPSVARGVSFLKDRLGEAVFASGIDIIDDPFRARGIGSRSHDGEGRAVAETKLIDDGVLTRWLLNGSSARQLGLTPNGFAGGGFGDPPGVGTSNTYLQAGMKSPADLMTDVGEGLLVTDMFGPSINPNTGDYSVGVSGFWFEGGEISHPVSEVTIAGDLPDMFARLVPASDLEFRGRRDAPSVLIEGMTIAGS
ncbi:MAG: TldD/PmbA family protein [Pseudomonadota bacterium]